ncbi:MAG: methyltransferase domain-containing protein, partial [Flavobacteriales bacterium]|nr:methyltransferase domain-containing protein [Flavobacteriales bacterium]
MGRNKLFRYAENDALPNVIQPGRPEDAATFPLKGKWSRGHFHKEQPVTLELGCGKGEYTLGMGRAFPDINFIGVDIKGARIWRGAKTALDENLGNVAFLRTPIERI